MIFTMKMEILLEPTSNKLMVDPHGFEGIFKDGDGVLKLKKFKKDALLKFSRLSNQERYEHVGPEVTSSRDGQVYKDDEKRLCLVDDLKNDDVTWKNKVVKEMVNSMLSYSGLSQGFCGEAMLIACYLLNRIPNKRNMITPYELWTKKKPNLNYIRVWGCRTVVRLPDPKLKTLGERSIECILLDMLSIPRLLGYM
ncbi:zinc finger, CCHC-type containing protein [Tanacetum coccineum]